MGSNGIFWIKRNNSVQETDRRCEPRFAMFCFADIYNAVGEPIIETTIRDLSEHGAHLRVKSAEDIPEKLIVRSHLGRNIKRARLRWVSGANIGVEFYEDLRSLSKR